MRARRSVRGFTIVTGTVLAFAAGSGMVGADLVASAPAGPAHRVAGEVSRATVDRAVAEVTDALIDSGRPPCGNVTVSIAPTSDGRSWSWPASCHILLDATLVEAGGGPFRYVVRHELAHLIRGVDHYDPAFRALETSLAADIGYDLVYRPGSEYPTLIERHPS